MIYLLFIQSRVENMVGCMMSSLIQGFSRDSRLAFLKLNSICSTNSRAINDIIDVTYHFDRKQITMSQRLSTLKSHIATGQPSLLKEARDRVTLCGEELKDILFGVGNFNNYVKPYLEYIDNNRHIFSHHTIEGHSLEDQRKEAAKMVLALRKFWKLDLINEPIRLVFIQYAMGMFNGGICVKSLLHYFLYAKSLLLYQSNPKHSELYKRAISGEDIGCFSLTEFHHGSYSKGIETLAVYDPSTDEFVLTTQGTKGMKFWIGALAQLANVTVVWAQLIINGQSKGPHPFFLNIRSSKNHQVLPGIKIGDCGPKKGLNYIDNGYMILNDVRIPRQNLLGKYGAVNQKGIYSSPIKEWGARFGVHMSALSAGRGFLALTTMTTSLNACTIALRYAHSRKQFETTDKTDEIPIIQYPLTQIRLIPQIATNIVQIPAGTELALIYGTDSSLFTDDKYLNEMHAISAAVKSRFSWSTLKAAQECRSILGGHGYSVFARIPSIVDDIDVNVTWEGDNTMLLQQTSKYLMKVIPNKIQTKVLDLRFIHDQKNIDFDALQEKICQISVIQEMIQDLLRQKYLAAAAKFKQLVDLYRNKEEAELHFHPQAGNALSLAYADYYTFSVMKKKLSECKNKDVRMFLEDCLRLWAFSLLERERYGPQAFRSSIQKEIVRLSASLVDRTVVATDILTPSSFMMGSPFGNADGEGFKEYINLLFTRRDAFTKANHVDEIKSFTMM